MWWMAAVAVVQAVVGFLGENDAAKAQRITNKANADAENTVRKARNQQETAVAALDNAIRSVRNKQILEAAGSQYNALGQNIVRLEDQSLKGGVEQRIASAEALGELSAASASAGIGGGVVDTLEQTMRLQQARAEQERRRQTAYQVGDMYQSRSGLILNAINSMDSGLDLATQDFSVSQPGYVAGPSALSYIAKGFSNAYPYVQNAFQNNGGGASEKFSSSMTEIFGHKGGGGSDMTSSFSTWLGGK